MQEVFKDVSTNGRSGLAIVAESEVSFPAKGRLVLLGTFEGVKTFKFEAAQDGKWFYVGGEIEAVSGAVVVESAYMQSNNYATIIAGGDFFVIRSFGYKRRSSNIRAFNNGVEIELPATVMAAMGLIPAENKPVVVEIPAIESPIAEALRKARIV